MRNVSRIEMSVNGPIHSVCELYFLPIRIYQPCLVDITQARKNCTSDPVIAPIHGCIWGTWTDDEVAVAIVQVSARTP